MATLFTVITLVILAVAGFRYVTSQNSDRPRLRASGALQSTALAGGATIVAIIAAVLTSVTLFLPIVAGAGTVFGVARTRKLLNPGR